MRHPPRTIVVAACLLGVTAAACTDTGSPGPPAQASATPIITEIVVSSCTPPDCSPLGASVLLTWSAPAVAVDGYLVMRDGQPLESTPPLGPDATTLTDASARIGESYRYEVTALTEDGSDLTSPAETIEVPTPPKRAAYLHGRFRVVREVTGAINLASLDGIPDPRPGDRGVTRWSFEAECGPDEAPCPVIWNGARGSLTPVGRVYEGLTVPGRARCSSGQRVEIPVYLSVRITEAEAIDGVWQAIRIEGRLSSAFRCPGDGLSTGEATFTGDLLM